MCYQRTQYTVGGLKYFRFYVQYYANGWKLIGFAFNWGSFTSFQTKQFFWIGEPSMLCMCEGSNYTVCTFWSWSWPFYFGLQIKTEMERLLKDTTESWKTNLSKICDTLIKKVPKTDHHVSIFTCFLFFFTYLPNVLSIHLLHPFTIDLLLNDAYLHRTFIFILIMNLLFPTVLRADMGRLLMFCNR